MAKIHRLKQTCVFLLGGLGDEWEVYNFSRGWRPVVRQKTKCGIPIRIDVVPLPISAGEKGTTNPVVVVGCILYVN